MALSMDLTELYTSGSEEDFATLYKHYRRKGLALAKRILKNLALAEDAYQDAMLNLWKKREQFQNKCRFETYAHRVVINAALMIKRKVEAMEKKALQLKHQPQEVIAVEDDNIGSVQFAKAIYKLRPASTELALVLAKNEGLSIRAGAKKYGISPAAFKTRVYRMRAQLDQAING